jgi:hypothetical protein
MELPSVSGQAGSLSFERLNSLGDWPGALRTVLVVVFEPAWQIRQHRERVRCAMNRDIVALEGCSPSMAPSNRSNSLAQKFAGTFHPIGEPSLVDLISLINIEIAYILLLG